MLQHWQSFFLFLFFCFFCFYYPAFCKRELSIWQEAKRKLAVSQWFRSAAECTAGEVVLWGGGERYVGHSLKQGATKLASVLCEWSEWLDLPHSAVVSLPKVNSCWSNTDPSSRGRHWKEIQGCFTWQNICIYIYWSNMETLEGLKLEPFI